MYEEVEFATMVHYPDWPEGREVIEEVHRDEELNEIMTALQQGGDTKQGFSYNNGVLFYESQLVASDKSPWIPILLQEFHSTHQRVAANLHWFGIKRCIQLFVRECDAYQREST